MGVIAIINTLRRFAILFRLFLAVLIAAVLAGAPSQFAQAQSAPPSQSGKKDPAPDISHFVLSNGLEVVVIPDHRVPVVTHMVWYKVGSADEPPGQSGVAHFLEHLMFKGTEQNPAGK